MIFETAIYGLAGIILLGIFYNIDHIVDKIDEFRQKFDFFELNYNLFPFDDEDQIGSDTVNAATEKKDVTQNLGEHSESD